MNLVHTQSDFYGMSQAFKEAEKALKKNEVPVGAVAFFEGRLIARAHNVRETKKDPLGHAEIVLISKIAKKISSWRLGGVSVYVTLEPCLMCMGALLQARIERLVFGCLDPKAGACGSLYDFSQDLRLNHRIEVKSGILAEQCSQILSQFFKNLRNQKRSLS